MPNYLDSLIDKIGDAALESALRAEIDRFRDNKQLGLLFERHIPETIRLFTHPVKRGLKVQERARQAGPTWTVTRVSDGQAHLSRRAGDETLTDVCTVTDLDD